MPTMTPMKTKAPELHTPVEDDPEVRQARERAAALQEEGRTLVAEDRQIGRLLNRYKDSTDPMPDASPAERIALGDRRAVITTRRRAHVGELATAEDRLVAARARAFAERIGSARERIRGKLGGLWAALEVAVEAQKALDAEVVAVNALLGRDTFRFPGWPGLRDEVEGRRGQPGA